MVDNQQNTFESLFRKRGLKYQIESITKICNVNKNTLANDIIIYIMSDQMHGKTHIEQKNYLFVWLNNTFDYLHLSAF